MTIDCSSGPSRRWRGTFGGTLLLGMTVATYMTFILGVLAPFLLDEFAIPRTQLGLLTTTLYIVGGLGSPMAGRVVDHFGGKRALMGLFAAGALGVTLLATAQTYLWLIASVVLTGLALAAGNPVTNKLVARHLPVGARGTIMGIKQAGVPTGTFLAGLLLPGAALALGWRGAILLALALPVVGLISTQLLLPPDEPPVHTTRVERRSPLGSAVRWLTLYAFFIGTGVATVNVYLPLYAYDQIGLDVTTAGLITSTIGAVGMFSRVLWGRLSERTGRVTAPLLLIALLSTTSIICVITATWWGGVMLWIAALLFGGATLGWIVVGMMGIVSEIGVAQAGRASGRVQFGFYSGFIASPVVFGAIVDATGRYELAWGMIAMVFGSASAIAFAWHRSERRI